MALKWFICPDKAQIEVVDCLAQCRMAERCMTLPTLTMVGQERVWQGIASTTQLINGTLQEFLKLTNDYAVDPDSRAFMIAGTQHHSGLEFIAKTLNLPSEVALSGDRDIFDLLEPEEDGYVLSDYKLWGEFQGS